MRTTVDLPPSLLTKTKRLAQRRKSTLSAVVQEALAAYLGTARAARQPKPFELIVRGKAGMRFPTPAEMAEVEEDEESRALGIAKTRRHAAS
jgi:predicted transcriptional regulator